MSLIAKLEAGLIERLKMHLPSPFYIAAFPNDPNQFDMSAMKAACLVHFSGSRYGKPDGFSAVQQSRELRFTLSLYLFALRAGEDERLDAYGTIERLRKAIQNIRLEGCKPFVMVSEQLVGQEGGRWDWQIDITCEAPAIAAEQNIPRLNYPLNAARQEA